jgi:metal-responsive CopG/Arc/MetJ family transcriptional regulator
MPDDSESQRIIIPMSRELLDRVDEHRFSNRIATRAAAIRQLLEAALKPKEKDQPKCADELPHPGR